MLVVNRMLLLAIMLVAVPAFAQMEFSGEWTPVPNEDNLMAPTSSSALPMLGDYLGIPINEAARRRAETWDASIQTLPEWQCRPHGATYITRGPSQVRIWKEVDEVSREIVAWHAEWLRSVDRPIYMDGRRILPILRPTRGPASPLRSGSETCSRSRPRT